MTNTHALAAAHSLAIALAGDDFTWEHSSAPSQIDSAHRIGLAAILTERQGGLCAACGDALAGERSDLCHIVASRISARGFLPGNVYVGHVGCNSDDSKTFGNGIVPLASLVRSDVVQTEWPTRKECVTRAAEIRATREARRARRVALAG